MQPLHFVILSVGSLGDLYPFLSLAHTLRQRGHRVTFCGLTYHADSVQQAGIPFIGIGTRDDYLQRIRDPDLWHPVKGFQVFLRNCREHLSQSYHDFMRFASGESYVVLAHPFALPSADLFRLLHPQASIVAVHLAPASIRSCADPLQIGSLRIPSWCPKSVRKVLWWLVDTYMLDPAAVPEINEVRQSHGCPPITHFMQHLMDAPDLTLLLFPAWYAARQADWATEMLQGVFPLFDPRTNETLSDELQSFLKSGDAPLVFTPGTAHCHAAAYFQTALTTVQRLGKRAIFLTQYPEQLPPQLPSNVLWQAYVPLQVLLPHVAGIIHHGGIGTTAEALRAGVPQLLVPFAWDQFDNASRVQSLGVGASLHAMRLNVRNMTAQLRNLLQSHSVALRCREVARQFAGMPTMNDFCQTLEERLSIIRMENHHD